MADRYPLIYNPTANQIQELQSGDSIDLGGGNLKNTVFSGIITATGFSGDGSALTNISVTETSTLDNVLARVQLLMMMHFQQKCYLWKCYSC